MSKSDKMQTTAAPGGYGRATTHLYDWDETAPSLAVAETIAAATEREPADSRPLYDALEPDALDDVVQSHVQRGSGHVGVTFTHEGYEVSVSGDGEVTVWPTANADR